MFSLYANGNLITKRQTLDEIEIAAVHLKMAFWFEVREKHQLHRLARLNGDCKILREEMVE